MKRALSKIVALGCVLLIGLGRLQAAEPAVIAVASSSPAELAALENALTPDSSARHPAQVNGRDFIVADTKDGRYVYFLAGPGLVNAAMNTQLALDHFNVHAVYFAGVARGVDPAFGAGDVVVPAFWAYHSEGAYFNETAPGEFALAGAFRQKYANFGMIFPDDVTVKRDDSPEPVPMASFAVDDKLLAAAKAATDAMPPLKTGDRVSKIALGGVGVSGSAYCDNAEYRKWIFNVWRAACVDTEAAAIAQVCWENRVPCLLVQGLDGLAGAEADNGQSAVARQTAQDHAVAVLHAVLGGAPGQKP